MSNKKQKKSIKTDPFGFPKQYKYNRQINYPIMKPATSIKNVVLWVLLVFFIIMVIGMLYISGYIAWNEFTNDPIWLKLGKTYIAVMFSPVFLFYIFCKSIMFNLPR